MQKTVGQLGKCVVRCWTALLGARERERACLRASTSHGNLARNSTDNQDGLKALRGKYICPVFFIVVFQDMNLSCSWGRFWLSALCECNFTVHTANANQKATVTPECAPDQHQCYAFFRALQFSEACTGSFCRGFKLGSSCLQS